MAVAGSVVPPDPLQPIPMTLPDGSTAQVHVQNAVVEVWGGVFNDPGAGWIPGSGTLLWPGTRVYLQAQAAGTDTGGGAELEASRVRIIGEPSAERVKLLELSDLQAAVEDGSALALLGSRETPGIYLLGADGSFGSMRTARAG